MRGLLWSAGLRFARGFARAARAFPLLVLLATGACAQYAITTPNALQQPDAVVEIPDNVYSVRERIENYLRGRSRLERVVLEGSSEAEVHFIQPWIRDSSLRYYMLDFDTRRRHLSEWKAQWSIEALGSNRTLVRVRVLEVLYVGPPQRASALPTLGTRQEMTGRTPIGSGDWFETDEDNLRAAAELRRFWVQHYPLQSLPKALSHLPIVSLEALPTARERVERRWDQLSRARSF